MTKKPTPTFLVKQPHGYCFRINVPVDLRKIVNLREIRYSLKTTDYLYARANALFLGLQVRRFFSELRERSDYLSRLTPQDFKRLIKEFVSNELDKAETKRLLCNDISTSQVQNISAEHSNLSYLSWQALRHRDYDKVSNQAQSLLKEHGITIDADTVEFKKLCRELLKATGFVASINRDRENGVYGTEKERDKGFYETYLAEPVKHVPAASEDKSPILSESIKKFLNERSMVREWKPDYKKEMIACLKLFQEFVGEETQTSQIDCNLTVAFKEALYKLPPNRRKKKIYRDKSLKEILEMDVEQTLAVNTVKNT